MKWCHECCQQTQCYTAMHHRLMNWNFSVYNWGLVKASFVPLVSLCPCFLDDQRNSALLLQGWFSNHCELILNQYKSRLKKIHFWRYKPFFLLVTTVFCQSAQGLALMRTKCLWPLLPLSSFSHIPHTLTVFFHLMSVQKQCIFSCPEVREEEGLSSDHCSLLELTSSTDAQGIRTKPLNTMKIFPPISPPCFPEGRQWEEGGFGGFVWIVFDQTGPLLGSLLTFSIQRGWGASRPSHRYKALIAVPLL